MSDRLTDEQIEELERLEREADEWCGPRWEAMGAPDPDLRREAWLRTPMRDDGSATLVALDMAPENAALAAAMRNALPSLLAEVRAARSLSPAPSTTRAPGGDEAECSHEADRLLAEYARKTRTTFIGRGTRPLPPLNVCDGCGGPKPVAVGYCWDCHHKTIARMKMGPCRAPRCPEHGPAASPGATRGDGGQG